MPDSARWPAPLTISADGAYAARLVAEDDAGHGAGHGDRGWCVERWTLSGPEPYAVRLPAGQPEDPASQVLPLADGRVLVSRPGDGGWDLALLYPSSPDTGELPLGRVECETLALLPPAPDGARAYALVPGAPDGATELWLVCGGGFGPQLVARVPGQCAGGAWLDREGRLLAFDRTDDTGRTRTVAIDVEHGGEPTELLQIAEDSNDRLLLADPDSGLLLVCSDAPGVARVGWGVLGSHRPVRFPEALCPEGVAVTPFAVQPGQVLLPESCGVALRLTAHETNWVGVWRPQQRELQHVAAPEGWLAGTGLWTVNGLLLLPYATVSPAPAGPSVPAASCGLARIDVPVPAPQPLRAGVGHKAPPVQQPALSEPAWTEPRAVAAETATRAEAKAAPSGTEISTAETSETETPKSETWGVGSGTAKTAAAAAVREQGRNSEPSGPRPSQPAPGPPSADGVTRPVPLQQAPLAHT